MTRFDYLHSARPRAVRAILELRIPRRLHAALYALAAACACVAGAALIEAHRFHESLRIEATYRFRYEQSMRELRGMNLYYERVAHLARLDRQIRRIIASGDAEAQRIAEIAKALPERAWLTAISGEPGGVSLEGRAANLNVLGRFVRSLSAGRSIGDPTLVSASLVADPSRAPMIEYALHLQARGQ
jgi:Tfp pilus assembly protein PilN